MDDSSALPPGEHHRVADHQRGEADEAKPRYPEGTKRLFLSITIVRKLYIVFILHRLRLNLLLDRPTFSRVDQ